MARVSLASLTSIAISVVIAIVPACTAVEPEVGERLTACVDADSNPAVNVVFKDQIRPLMQGLVPGPKPCANCHYHSGGTREGLNETGFDLETLGTLRKGGRRTFDDIVVPGQPCKSAIVQKLKGTYEGARMPKGGPYWTAEQIQLMIDWIAEGAPGADTE
jgi:hypothetical protein